ncbi:F0F1 ATP synthase subunit delta [Limimaricola pyoseonensis]|uniref:ATP synthase subunit delta n=1 Tax=Limimaricola pyoseonensis TaxID=521013 RepID=A0A1G7CFM9_9RHOB|nr:F0F1 ATP synthase subunit delta [Limimaricola pyoseonensis]SDE38089.1 ATP synthase F1 subcomplex delta subunit [Limimaricola pyoseonensis]
MSEPASISTGIAQRYATAVFDLAREDDALAALGKDVDALKAALAESADFRDLISSPVYPRDEQGRAMAAIAQKMALTQTMGNVLGLMASKRRLFVLPQMLRALDEKLAEARGEITADVTTAKPLSDKQAKALAEALKQSAGREVKINQTVDESLIGGLVVKLGSKMVDTSIRSKLQALQNTMKEVG